MDWPALITIMVCLPLLGYGSGFVIAGFVPDAPKPNLHAQTMLRSAALDHELLDARSVEQWDHPEGCPSCKSQASKVVLDRAYAKPRLALVAEIHAHGQRDPVAVVDTDGHVQSYSSRRSN